MDIDIQNYAGETVPAAVEQPESSANSYQNELDDAGIVHQELLEVPKSAPNEQPAAHPQAEHFKALREEVSALKTKMETDRLQHEEQMALLRANTASREAPVRQKEVMFDGMREDDIPNVADIRKEWAHRESEYRSRIEELQVQQSYPDYAEVIQKFALPLVQQKPHLAEGIQGASNKALYAYELGKMAQMAAQRAQTPVEEPVGAPAINSNAQRIVENSRKPGTLSQAGGQGALSKADYYASMSDAEFAKFATRHLEQI